MPLGRLERVDLRTEWTSEASGFTPWLAEEENLRLLGETVGIELALEGTEQNVGPFRADILCKEAGSSDHSILIENQLERTDHVHLGQLLTYAAGLHTVTVIWVARKFTDEHRAALDWLNEVTIPEIGFFGLEVELWRIGDSPAAPKFNVVSRPNDFVKAAVEKAKTVNSKADLYVEYWTAFKAYVEVTTRNLKCLKPQGDYWMDLSMVGPGMRVRVMAGARDKFNMVDFVIYNDAGKSKIAQFMSRRDEIEAITGPLNWRRKEGYKESAVELRLGGPDPSDRSDWPNQHQWLLENAERFLLAFGSAVKASG